MVILQEKLLTKWCIELLKSSKKILFMSLKLYSIVNLKFLIVPELTQVWSHVYIDQVIIYYNSYQIRPTWIPSASPSFRITSAMDSLSYYFTIILNGNITYLLTYLLTYYEVRYCISCANRKWFFKTVILTITLRFLCCAEFR